MADAKYGRITPACKRDPHPIDAPDPRIDIARPVEPGGPPPEPGPEDPALPDALQAAVDDAVAAALAASFPVDPLLGPSLSALVSVSNSIVKRHGVLLETGVAYALEASGRFHVARNVLFPVTRAADHRAGVGSMAGAPGALRFTPGGVRAADIDIPAVDTHAGIAYALPVRRGGGATEALKRRVIEGNMAAVNLLLQGYCARHGFAVRETRTAVVDYYGNAGFPPGLTVTRETLDAFLGVPVVATVEAMTDALRRRLADALPDLLARAEPPFSPDDPPAGIPVAAKRLPLGAGSLRRGARALACV